MPDKKTILVYYHDDADGICSAAIINKLYRSHYNIDCRSINYGKETILLEDLDNAYLIYMVDFTSAHMGMLIDNFKDKFVWIDHHKTAMETYPEYWKDSTINGIRNLEKSGCGLTWEYCYPTKIPPFAVKYIEDRDIWKFEYFQTKAFCEGFNNIINDPYDTLWDKLLDNEYCDPVIQHFVNIGEILIKAQKVRVKRVFDNGIDITFNGLKARCINSTTDISEIGEYVYTKPEYEIAVIWQAIDTRIVVSLRSNSKDVNAPDCAKIAQEYGGGGHTNAAGFSVINAITVEKNEQ